MRGAPSTCVLLTSAVTEHVSSFTRSGVISHYHQIMETIDINLFSLLCMLVINVCKDIISVSGSPSQDLAYVEEILLQTYLFSPSSLGLGPYRVENNWLIGLLSDPVRPTMFIFFYKQMNNLIVLHKILKWNLKYYLWIWSDYFKA